MEKIKKELNETLRYIRHILKFSVEKSSKYILSPASYIVIAALVFNTIAFNTINTVNNPIAYDLKNIENKGNNFALNDKLKGSLMLIQYQNPLTIIPLDEVPVYEYVVDNLSLEESSSERQSAYVNDPTSKVQWPFPYGSPISSGYGEREPSCKYCSSYHQGTDFTPGLGTPVQSIAEGIVIETKNYQQTYVDTQDASYGSYVLIQHNIDGLEFQSLYSHLMFNSISVKAGDKVNVGDFIAKVGETGMVTGPHLHFEIRVRDEKINPVPWLTEMNAKTSQKLQ
jgi:murein DD-endopeptidase MepM/ murein hydrolase activator NlpD